MNRNPTICEFEALLTTRILSTRMTQNGVLIEKIEHTKMLDNVRFACIDLLRGFNLHRSLRVVRRRDRIFLISESTRKIVAEVGLDFELAAKNKIKRPRALLVSRYKLPKTINDLSQERRKV